MRPGGSVDAGAGTEPVDLLDGLELGAELAGQGGQHRLGVLKHGAAVSTDFSKSRFTWNTLGKAPFLFHVKLNEAAHLGAPLAVA